MAGHTRTVHPASSFLFDSIDVFAPDLGIRQEADNGGPPVTPKALCFIDPDDDERHVYVFSDEGRAKLIAQLTGGIAIVPGGALPK